MKREALLAHLASHGCKLSGEGGGHSIWQNQAGEIQSIPRHREIKKFTTRSICRKLGVPVPKGA